MKITNEAKIGILAFAAIALLILGFNFLKGRNLLNKNNRLHAVFHSVSGLTTSNPVTVKGLQIGTVYEIIEKNKNLDSIVVTINLDKEVNIPLNSLAFINRDLLGTASLNIEMGNGSQLIKNGDTLNTEITSGLVDDVKASLNPALNNINNVLKSLDSLVEVVGAVFDPATKFNFHKIVTNLTLSSASLQALLNNQTGALAKTLSNMDQVTGNLAKNNESINRTIGNLEIATGKLAGLNLDTTITNLNNTVKELNGMVTKMNSTDGSLGLLLNDKKLYENLESTSRSMNILLDDLRVNPKRYVSISVFGKKNKGNYLTKPLIDSTATGSK